MIQLRLIVPLLLLYASIIRIGAHITWIEAKYPLQVSLSIKYFDLKCLCLLNDVYDEISVCVCFIITIVKYNKKKKQEAEIDF